MGSNLLREHYADHRRRFRLALEVLHGVQDVRTLTEDQKIDLFGSFYNRAEVGYVSRPVPGDEYNVRRACIDVLVKTYEAIDDAFQTVEDGD